MASTVVGFTMRLRRECLGPIHMAARRLGGDEELLRKKSGQREERRDDYRGDGGTRRRASVGPNLDKESRRQASCIASLPGSEDSHLFDVARRVSPDPLRAVVDAKSPPTSLPRLRATTISSALRPKRNRPPQIITSASPRRRARCHDQAVLLDTPSDETREPAELRFGDPFS